MSTRQITPFSSDLISKDGNIQHDSFGYAIPEYPKRKLVKVKVTIKHNPDYKDTTFHVRTKTPDEPQPKKARAICEDNLKEQNGNEAHEEEKNNNNGHTDEEIIRALVMERFKDILERRRRKRKNRPLVANTKDNEESDDSHIYDEVCLGYDDNDYSVIKESMQMFSDSNDALKDLEDQPTETDISGITSEYDVGRFLSDALGDELHTYDTSGSTHINTRLFQVQEPSSVCEQSIGTSNISTLISLGSSLYTSISKTINRLSMFTNTTATILESNESRRTSRNHSIDQLYDEAVNTCSAEVAEMVVDCSVQYEMMQQLSKALEFCKTKKEFVSSIEHVEAERLLLLTACRRSAILNQISLVDYKTKGASRNFGEVTIRNLRFSTNPNTECNKEYTNWFVCILSCNGQAFATEAVAYNVGQTFIEFKNGATFKNLPWDFDITVTIYTMSLKRVHRNYSHESKYHLKENSTNRCPSPSKFFTLSRRSRSATSNRDIVRSSFVFSGVIVLQIGDLKHRAFTLHDYPPNAIITGIMTMEQESRINVSETMEGFLNVGTKMGQCITWDKRWCVLDHTLLKIWNDPADVDVTPLFKIDLSVAGTTISAADRSICPRPRTLLLEKPNVRLSDKSRWLFLSADTMKEYKDWEEKFNSVLLTLREWGLGCNEQ